MNKIYAIMKQFQAKFVQIYIGYALHVECILYIIKFKEKWSTFGGVVLYIY